MGFSVYRNSVCGSGKKNNIIYLEENNVFMCRDEQFAFVEEKCIRVGFKEMQWSQREEQKCAVLKCDGLVCQIQSDISAKEVVSRKEWSPYFRRS